MALNEYSRFADQRQNVSAAWAAGLDARLRAHIVDMPTLQETFLFPVLRERMAISQTIMARMSAAKADERNTSKEMMR